MKPFSVWYTNGEKEKTRLGLQKELDITNQRMITLHSFLYAFEDYMVYPSPSKFKALKKCYNDLYPICKDDDCPCPWKDEAWKVLEYPDKL